MVILKQSSKKIDMASTISLQGTELQAKTRVLLTLWQMGGAEEKVKKSELTTRSKRSREKAGDYKDIFNDLQEAGAIAIVTEKRVAKVSLTEKGKQILGEGLKNPDFSFDGNQVGSKVVNAVLNWYRQSDANVLTAPVTEKEGAKEGAIASYEAFEKVALEVYDRLNRDYNLDDLVPIYRIRREIASGVSREQFKQWMLEMQANDIFQLMGGEMPDITPDRREDSIETPVGGLRYYAKRLN